MGNTKTLIVNGVDFMPWLEQSPVQIEDLDSEDTARNSLGDLTRDRIAVKHKIALTFIPLFPDELATILTAVKPKEVSVTYTDPETNTEATGQFYAGPRNPGQEEGADRLTYDVTFNLIEL